MKAKTKERIQALEADVHDEARNRIACQDQLHRIRAALAGRVPENEIGITFKGWVDHIIYILDARFPVDVPEAPADAVDAMADVLSERGRQDAKWGEQNHDPFVYGAILSEELGEFLQVALKARFESGTPSETDRARFARTMREEAVQVAAVALAIVECLDRGKWTWGGHALPAAQPVAPDEPPGRLALLDGLEGHARVDAAHNAAIDCGRHDCSWCRPTPKGGE